MPWNCFQAELFGDAGVVRPRIGPGRLSRESAYLSVEGLIGAAGLPDGRVLAARWRTGTCGDVLWRDLGEGWLVWGVYPHPAGEDHRLAALARLEQLMRDAAGRER